MKRPSLPPRSALKPLFAAVVFGLVTTLVSVAQPAPGGAPGGRGVRGPGGAALSPEQFALVEKLNTALAAEAAAVHLASSNLVAASLSAPVDDARVTSANAALSKAREAWARKAAAEFARLPASDPKLNEAAIRMLINSAPGGGRPGRGPGGPGGPGGPERRPPGAPPQ